MKDFWIQTRIRADNSDIGISIKEVQDATSRNLTDLLVIDKVHLSVTGDHLAATNYQHILALNLPC